MTDEQVDQAIRDRARLMVSLTNITPNDEEVERIEHVREIAKQLGGYIVLNIRAGRERSLAQTHLEETVMWAVKAILMEDVGIVTKNHPVHITPDKGVIGQQTT